MEEASHWGLVLNRRVLAVAVPEVLLRWTQDFGQVAKIGSCS